MSLWLSNFEHMPMEPSAQLAAWLKTPTSITDKAKASCHHVRLQLLSERWEIKQQKSVFDRQILILCDEKLAWYAQTLIPEKTYALRAEQFQKLKNRPISTILFEDPTIIREDFVYAYLTPTMPEYQQAIQYYHAHCPSCANPDSLWARKSIFRIDNQPLSIMEIFFPDVLDLKR